MPEVLVGAAAISCARTDADATSERKTTNASASRDFIWLPRMADGHDDGDRSVQDDCRSVSWIVEAADEPFGSPTRERGSLRILPSLTRRASIRSERRSRCYDSARGPL